MTNTNKIQTNSANNSTKSKKQRSNDTNRTTQDVRRFTFVININKHRNTLKNNELDEKDSNTSLRCIALYKKYELERKENPLLEKVLNCGINMSL